jgi:hypothetical protein
VAKKDLTKEIAEEIDVLDDMLATLIDLLKQKRIITEEEWEKHIRETIAKNSELKKYRDIQFKKPRI